MQPLTAMTSKQAKFSWTAQCEQVFRGTQKLLSETTLLHYPNFNEPFTIHTDSSSFQLGGVISQNGKPLAFFSRKLSTSQRNYTVTEQEMLSIVELLKEYRNILLGRKIVIYTDHKNLSFTNFTNPRVHRWRLIVEEFGPTIKYIRGITNVAAEALSRLTIQNTEDTVMANDDDFLLKLSIVRDQQKTAGITGMTSNVEGIDIVVDKHGRVVVPDALQLPAMQFYHQSLLHPGATRMSATMKAMFAWAGMDKDITKFVKNCHICQVWKTNNKKYGQLPPKLHSALPWTDVHVDLIGPYEGHMAMTMLDASTGWFEMIAIPDKKGATVARLFDEAWICRYPRPQRCVHDQGEEFTCNEFQELLRSYGIQDVPTTVKNPQANGQLERLHQVIHNMVRTAHQDDPNQEWIQLIPAVSFAIRASFNTTIGMSPALAVFKRDMIWNKTCEIDNEAIVLKRQYAAHQNNARENKNRISHDYHTKDLVLLQSTNKRKHAQRHLGPYEIVKVHDNGNVTIDKNGYYERVNIRRILPYKG
ncbi:hypothetical protein AeMF1_020706 [Aphanomyces euteiches]|nr:hypothetical protein AeMF1_020706 [Aphanomyces euteiches]